MVWILPLTIPMGATFPAMVDSLERMALGNHRRVMTRFYGCNLLGAIAASVLGPYLFFPAWGLDGVLRFVFLVNASVSAIGLLLAALASGERAQTSRASADAGRARPPAGARFCRWPSIRASNSSLWKCSGRISSARFWETASTPSRQCSASSWPDWGWARGSRAGAIGTRPPCRSPRWASSWWSPRSSWRRRRAGGPTSRARWSRTATESVPSGAPSCCGGRWRSSCCCRRAVCLGMVYPTLLRLEEFPIRRFGPRRRAAHGEQRAGEHRRRAAHGLRPHPTAGLRDDDAPPDRLWRPRSGSGFCGGAGRRRGGRSSPGSSRLASRACCRAGIGSPSRPGNRCTSPRGRSGRRRSCASSTRTPSAASRRSSRTSGRTAVPTSCSSRTASSRATTRPR